MNFAERKTFRIIQWYYFLEQNCRIVFVYIFIGIRIKVAANDRLCDFVFAKNFVDSISFLSIYSFSCWHILAHSAVAGKHTLAHRRCHDSIRFIFRRFGNLNETIFSSQIDAIECGCFIDLFDANTAPNYSLHHFIALFYIGPQNKVEPRLEVLPHNETFWKTCADCKWPPKCRGGCAHTYFRLWCDYFGNNVSAD